MKKIFLAMLLVAASLNVVACASRSANEQHSRRVVEERTVVDMSERTEAAQMEANDSLRK